MAQKERNNNQKQRGEIRLDDIHWKMINGLIPFYGSNNAEVLRTIVIMWLDQNIGPDKIKKLEELHAINFQHLKSMKEG